MPHRLSIRSLHDAKPGERLRVMAVLFDTLRARCADLGIRPGSEVCVLRRTADHLHVALRRGGTAVLRRAEAGFIEVQPVRRPDPSPDGLTTGPVAA